MYLGLHVSIGGKIYEAVDRAEKLGCSAMQIFSRNPRQWRELALNDDDAAEFRRRLQMSGVRVVVVHIPYLINLATSYDVLYKKSIAAYIEDMKETSRLGAQYLVTHMGSYKNSTMEVGIKQFIGALDIVLAETKDLDVKLLLENTAGSGHWLGATFEHHKRIIHSVKYPERLGVCLDTAHIFAAGFDIRRADVFDGLIEDIDHKIGIDALKVVHLNDSISACGSLADRHTHIGKGQIGLKAIKHIVNHPYLSKATFILETPKETLRSDPMNLRVVRKMIEAK